MERFSKIIRWVLYVSVFWNAPHCTFIVDENEKFILPTLHPSRKKTEGNKRRIRVPTSKYIKLSYLSLSQPLSRGIVENIPKDHNSFLAPWREILRWRQCRQRLDKRTQDYEKTRKKLYKLPLHDFHELLYGILRGYRKSFYDTCLLARAPFSGPRSDIANV